MVNIKPGNRVDVDGRRVGRVCPDDGRECVAEKEESERDGDVENHGGNRDNAGQRGQSRRRCRRRCICLTPLPPPTQNGGSGSACAFPALLAQTLERLDHHPLISSGDVGVVVDRVQNRVRRPSPRHRQTQHAVWHCARPIHNTMQYPGRKGSWWGRGGRGGGAGGGDGGGGGGECGRVRGGIDP